MAKYEVTYNLGQRSPSGASWTGSTATENLKMVVEATGPNQAREIVESMFGGRDRCQAYNGFKISD